MGITHLTPDGLISLYYDTVYRVLICWRRCAAPLWWLRALKLIAPDLPSPLCTQFQHKFQSFLAGSAMALGLSYYWMNQNVWQAAGMVGRSVETLGRDTESSHARLQARIVTLESDVAKLKEMLAAAKPKN